MCVLVAQSCWPFAFPGTVAHQAQILYCLSHQGSPTLPWETWKKIGAYLTLSGASWLPFAHTWAAGWRKNVKECSPERMWPFYCPSLWGMLLLTSFRKHRDSPGACNPLQARPLSLGYAPSFPVLVSLIGLEGGVRARFCLEGMFPVSLLLSHTEDNSSSRFLFSKSRLLFKIKAVEGHF